MSIFDWPATLVPRNIQVLPPRATQGLTESLTQFTQAQPVIRPPFTVTMEFDELFGRDVLAWRAMLALLEGRAHCARLPLFDLWYRASEAAIAAGLSGFSDGALFSDGASFSTSDLADVTVTGAQGQRWIEVDFGDHGQLLEGGLYFGIGEHPYIASSVVWTGTVARIRCSPTLRTAYADAPLKLKPTMIGRLTSDDGGALMLKNLRHGAPSITFQEDFVEPLS
ncbi:hypothetical protein [Novosphingobium huizhouense]|uniref:hypothetical protein n=1 Tax=Novosphingobium huizhouense TaxID=2866625 RepID=UPI001CD8A501|nr:hypothetical protein [Novosphingobium huizhouense]